MIRDEWISALGIRAGNGSGPGGNRDVPGEMAADEPGSRGGREGGSNEGKWESREAGDL